MTAEARVQSTVGRAEMVTTIGPRRGILDLNLRALWDYRELAWFLIWRDIKVRYKQTLIGISWAILQPMGQMVVLSFVFGGLADVSSDGLPYPIFSFAALLPWTYFAQGVGRSGESIVSGGSLVSKVYLPRLILPISSALAPLADFAIAFIILIGMMGWYGIAPTWGLVFLPFFMLFAVLAVLAVSLWLAALNVRYRDVRYAIPLMLQLGLYASPVIYPVSEVPEQWRLFYRVNPMTGVIEGFRWALLGNEAPDVTAIGISAAVLIVALTAGLVFFRRLERTFADVL